jgi:hypothetical protein
MPAQEFELFAFASTCYIKSKTTQYQHSNVFEEYINMRFVKRGVLAWWRSFFLYNSIICIALLKALL